jgi:hypothetical protein
VRATLEAINQMQTDGVISHYAIGGAVGAVEYSEPAATLEIEVLVILPFDPRGSSDSLAALHSYLMAHGYKGDGECFEIGSWPVRFLVAKNELEREAVAGSLPLSVNGKYVFVMMAEHLVAIALTMNRPKDLPWMLRLAQRDVIDELALKAILKSHDLIDKWLQFERDFPPQFPSKEEMRNRLASLSFSEKIKIMESLRGREEAIAASGLRRNPKQTSGKTPGDRSK